MNLDTFFEKAIRDGTFPGAVLLVGTHKDTLLFKAYGYRSLKPQREKNSTSTIYDLASMTKVIATTSAVMKIVENGLIRLSDPVGLFLEGFSKGNKSQILIRHLLTHTSGLPPYSESWKKMKGSELLKDINETELINDVGEKYLYSCLNFVLLMEVVERASGEKFQNFLSSNVFKPMDMHETLFNPAEELKSRIAPTSEREGKILRGEVDDEISYYLGGVSGNAGLFSTAADIRTFAQMMLNEGTYENKRIFSKSTIHLFTKEAFNDGETRRALGWDLKAKNSSCGDLASESAYGHTGFTGTSIWIDPVYDVFVVLLTNRVHISRKANQAQMIRFRAILHNYIFGHMEELSWES